MLCCAPYRQLARFLAALSLVATLFALPIQAQFGGGGGGVGGGGGGLGGGGGGNTVGGGLTSGVLIDANGVVSLKTVHDPTGELTRRRIMESFSALQGDLTERSPLRKVSLTRLEKLLRDGKPIDEAMKNLAGLTKIEYVFCYPEKNEIVLAGPAEPWGEMLTGHTRGLLTGRAILQLEDLIVAIRAFPPQGKVTNQIYCSIDPTQEGLARMQHYLKRRGGYATPNETQIIVRELQESLGPQVITVGGVPANTHFAQVMVEADYRMKLIGIGLEQPPVKMVSYVEKVNPAMVSRNAMQRWYFVPNYDCVRMSDDGLAVQIEGEGVRLIGEDEAVGRDGARTKSGRGSRASRLFEKSFTENYGSLAEKSPVYGQLRNCIDLAVAAAYMQDHDFYGKTEWEAAVFMDESKIPVCTVNAPKQVASAVNAMWKRSTLMTPIGGGVQIRPREAIDPATMLEDSDQAVAQRREELTPGTVAEGQWWWD